MLDATEQDIAAAPEEGNPIFAAHACEPAMKFIPVSVIVLLRYALLGNIVLLRDGKPKIVNAALGEDIETDDGLCMVT